MIKLPEPAHCCCLREPIYTKAQMLQFRQDLLEEAARVCDTTDIVTYTFAGQLYDSGAETLGNAIDAIRALLKETNVITF